MNNDHLKAPARQLVAQYGREGLGGMSKAEVQLLLSEKQLHLSEVGDRIAQGIDLHLNVPVKRGLEAQITEIGGWLKNLVERDSFLPPESGGKEESALFAEIRADTKARTLEDIKESFKNLIGGRMYVAANDNQRDNEIER